MSQEKRNSHKRSSSRISTFSNYGGSISDVEDINPDKYRKIAKKLYKDKKELKDKIKRLLKDIDIKALEHRKELEKSEEYFQEQVDDLLKERDKFKKEIQIHRELLFEEKDKLKQYYEQKLENQKHFFQTKNKDDEDKKINLTNEIQKQKLLFQREKEDEKRKIENEKEKEIINLKLLNQKISGESEEIIFGLKETIKKEKEVNKKLQETIQLINTQYVSTLNNQKKIFEREINSKNYIIQLLETKLNKIAFEKNPNYVYENINEELVKTNETLKKYTQELEGKINNLQTEQKSFEEKFKNILQKLNLDKVEMPNV